MFELFHVNSFFRSSFQSCLRENRAFGKLTTAHVTQKLRFGPGTISVAAQLEILHTGKTKEIYRYSKHVFKAVAKKCARF